MTGQTVDRDIGATRIHAQSVCQVRAQRIQVTLSLLDLCKLFGAAGFCDKVDGQLIGSSTANKVGEIAELQIRSWLGALGVRGDSRS